MNKVIRDLYRVALLNKLGSKTSIDGVYIVKCDRHENGFGISIDVGYGDGDYALAGLYFGSPPDFWHSSVCHIMGKLGEK